MSRGDLGASGAVGDARCVLFAYHQMGHACMAELLRMGAPIAALVTHADASGEEVWWPSCAELAAAHAIPVWTPAALDADWSARIAALAPAILYSFSYRYLLPETLLREAPLGAFNLHPSPLPRYRGRAPVNWMIANGEHEGGITLHHMVARADAGAIVGQRTVAISDDETALSLYQKLLPLGVGLIREFHPLIAAGRAPNHPQDLSRGSYFGRRRPEDGRIDWRWPARRIVNLVRAVTHPYPGAFAMLNGDKFYIWEARVGRETGVYGRPGTVIGPVGAGDSGAALEIAAGAGSVIVRRAQCGENPEGPAAHVIRRARPAAVASFD